MPLTEDIYIHIYMFSVLFSVTLDDLLRGMIGKVDLSMCPTANQINVVREDIFDCAMRAFRRQRFNPAAKIDVIFLDADGTGEGAADEGGPTREFLRLLMSSLHTSHIFEGPDWNKTLACNAQGEYQISIYRKIDHYYMN